jgi:hypothetical protein
MRGGGGGGGFGIDVQSENPLVKAQDIMLEYNMSQAEFDRIKEAFDRYDTDKNGCIGMHGQWCVRGLQTLPTSRCKNREQAVLADARADLLTPSTICMVWVGRYVRTSVYFRACACLCVCLRPTYLPVDASEVTNVLTRVGGSASPSDATDFIKSADINGNGTIEFWEVCRLRVAACSCECARGSADQE